MVRSRQAWLKSTKTRSPRSSFHHDVVTRSGRRRSSSRAIPMTPWRTSRNSWVGATRAYTWTPRLPLVLAQPVSPISVRSSSRASAASTASEKVRPGCGSRSIRSSSGSSLSAVRTGHGWKVMVFIWTAHTAAPTSSNTSWSCRRPLGYRHDTVRTQSGIPLGGFFW